MYGLFDVDTSEADNAFQLNEKFDNNSFLAFFVQTTSEGLANRLREPEITIRTPSRPCWGEMWIRPGRTARSGPT